MFVVWLTRAGHLNSTELLRYKVLQLYNALRLCGAVRQIVERRTVWITSESVLVISYAFASHLLFWLPASWPVVLLQVLIGMHLTAVCIT